MNRRPHPIDDTFRQKLEHFASDAPDYLWESIATQRSRRRKLYLHWRERALLITALLLFVYASVLTWSIRQRQPVLGTFPVALSSTSPVDAANAHAATVPSAANTSQALEKEQFANQPMAVTAPLPPIKQDVESLTEEWATAIENLTPEDVPATASTALAAFQLSALPFTLQQVSRKNQLPFEFSKCAAFSDHKPHFYFDILASPDYTFRNIQPKTGDFVTYANSRKETEAARFNYSSGIRLSVVSNSGLTLRAGLNYSVINERFELPNENETRIIVTYDQNGNIIKSDTITQKIVSNNHYQTLDIPVMIGYEIPIKKMTLAVNGGAYFNIQFKPEGEFLSPYDNRPISFSNEEVPENNLPAFRENLGIGWYGSVGVSYKISPRMQLLVEPHLKMYPRSFTRDDFMTDQRYLTAGVFVGLRHQFAL